MISIAVLTLSDKGSEGKREDESGPVIREQVSQLGEIVYSEILPDERQRIRNRLIELSDQGIRLILTTGGTGLSPRDVTPEATMDVAERIVPGMAEAMRLVNPDGLGRLSRARAGTRGRAVIINTPGSTKGTVETLEAVLDVLPHAVELVGGGRPH